MHPKHQYTAAEYRKFAKQIVLMTIVVGAAMFVYLAATDSLGEDFALMPLMLIPLAAMGVLVTLASAKYVDRP